MPTVLRVGPFQVRIFPNDHGQAHVHVFTTGGFAKIRLRTAHVALEVIKTDLRQAELADAVRMVETHNAFLLAEWRRIHGQDVIVP